MFGKKGLKLLLKNSNFFVYPKLREKNFNKNNLMGLKWLFETVYKNKKTKYLIIKQYRKFTCAIACCSNSHIWNIKRFFTPNIACFDN